LESLRHREERSAGPEDDNGVGPRGENLGGEKILGFGDEVVGLQIFRHFEIVRGATEGSDVGAGDRDGDAVAELNAKLEGGGAARHVVELNVVLFCVARLEDEAV